MAKKNVPAEDEIIDLTDLIEQGGSARAAAAYAKTAAAPVEEDDDFEAILAQTGATPPDREVDPHETLDMPGMNDIDNLMESLDIPPQPGKGAARQASPAQDEDLDSVLDDLLGDGPDSTAVPKSSPAPADNAAVDLGSFLEEAAPVREKPARETPLESDLDDILASFDQEHSKAEKAAPATGADNAALDADLDDILAEMEPPRPVAEKAPEPAQASTANDMAADLDDLLSETDSTGPAPAPPEQEIAEDLDDFLAEADASTSDTDADASDTPEPVEADSGIDKLDYPEEMQESDNAPILNAEETIAENLDDFLTNNNQPAPEEKAQISLAEAAPTDKKELPVAKDVREHTQAWPQDLIAGLYRNIAVQGNQETLQKFSHELGAQSAHVEDMGEQLNRLGKRLLACESILSAARVRIGNLEKAVDSATALEDLIREGTPLQAGFMSLISSAVANALKGFSPRESGTTNESVEHLTSRTNLLESRLAALEDRCKVVESTGEDILKIRADLQDMATRMATLESRVNALADSFEKELDKAVSTTVAKVLQEEITRLMQG